ncbi:choice-of-anchor D domain-containing protein [Conexibacter sp. CPCC 206217]|uniref:choice-of-anchor D domain-containing protein n=1 Tax=Conexibacter sp. CPCC 206217 TaxID=3064574 RepID=UPI0027161ED2|nr:choice-of-anchor D domain-containing protein [Conexibacter sp. CPCC 206217]MDO8213202.1 choice-of-anchor D domain-containing protein [Conexibacter sp. CPCC 206217]
MTQRTLRHALRAALVCVAIPAALAPAAASASTFTVDDDSAQCPSAAFRSIQAAVDQAAPWDTIIVCDGIYEEQSTPASGTGSPSATGSLNGLTITKPLTIKGTGASKVTIRPRSSLTTLAGTAPYLRDGGGNVVTISRQSRDATDINTMFVDISGVTIDAPTTYAEAGVAFFNANGAIRNSVVGPLLRATDSVELAARPHGWGVVMTNHFQGAEAGPHREVSIENSLVTGYQSGGILFDDSRGPDGDPTTLQRSGIVQYGYVRNSTVQGSGDSTLIPQTGIEYHSGQRGAVIGTRISDNDFTPDPRRSVGLLLTDADTGVDPSNPSERAFRLDYSSFTGNGYGMFNANAANTDVRLGAPAFTLPIVSGTTESYWGCSVGPIVGGASANVLVRGSPQFCNGMSGNDANSQPSIEYQLFRASAPPLATAPGTTVDNAPTAVLAEPADGKIIAGQPFEPTVSATDDFGVRSVELSLDGRTLGTVSTAPYEFVGGGFTPAFEEIGESHTFVASVTDSAGQTTVETVVATVVAPADYVAAAVDTTLLDAGSVTLGSTVDRTITVTNTGRYALTLRSLDLSGTGFSTVAGSGACTPGGTVAPGALCTITLRFAPTVEGAAAGTLSIPYTALGGGDPLVVALTGAGVAPEVRPPDTRPPVATVPVSTAAPKVTGSARVGSRLTCQPGGWSGAPTSYAYQWLRGGTPIAGATSATYTVLDADVLTAISCRVVAANAAGASAAATSTTVTASFTTITTKTTVAKQAGASIVTFMKAPKVSRRGVVTFAKVLYLGTGTGTIRATGTLKVGRAKFTLRITRKVARGKMATLSVRLSAKARRALKGKSGKLTLKVASRGGKSGSTSYTSTVK